MFFLTNTSLLLRNLTVCFPIYNPMIPYFLPNPYPRTKSLTKRKIEGKNMGSKGNSSNFQDFLPLMAEKLGGDGLIGELCNGFKLLMDADKGVITFESLKKNANSLLGLQELCDDDLRSMLEEGDFDGDGALNQMEFCVLMFRLSPELMQESQFLLHEALSHKDCIF